MRIIEVRDREEGGEVAAEIIKNLIKEKESPTLGLATGSSPETTYSCLVRAYEAGEISFSKV